jgi:site-specific DNA recombinase
MKRTKRAGLYLRASSAGQIDKDYDPEGFTIPAQRELGSRKAAELDAEVVVEWVERAVSAKTQDRPKLQEMLAYVKTHQLDYMIVHKLDRMARNRLDHLLIKLALREAGVTLVSVTEQIDEGTVTGVLLDGVISTMNEVYSLNLRTEVIKGMTQKAKAGGTPAKAPLGYLNVREIIDGREVRTVAIDTERGPLIAEAFELYATGEWTQRTLLDHLTERGLRNRATRTSPQRPLSLSRLGAILRSRYYIGCVYYRGAEYPGRHEPLVSQELFDRVQAVLALHNGPGERQRTHHHYLKGALYCARCGSRVSYMRVDGNGGQYGYFYCLGRHHKRTDCQQPYMLPALVETAVADYYQHVELGDDLVAGLKQRLADDLDHIRGRSRDTVRRQQARVDRLRAEEQKLLHLFYRDKITDELFEQEQTRIATELTDARRTLAAVQSQYAEGQRIVELALDLARDCQHAYQTADPPTRRLFNQVFFTKIFIDAMDGPTPTVAGTELASPFAELATQEPTPGPGRRPTTDRLDDDQQRRLVTGGGNQRRQHLVTIISRNEAGLNKMCLVGRAGVEPATDGL